MNKILLALLILFNASQPFAQITVTSATFPKANDTLRYAIDDHPTPSLVNDIYSPPGGNQIWDLTKIKPTAYFTTRYRTASEGVNANKFPGAGLVVVNPTNESYYKTDNTSFVNLGLVGKDPWGFNLNVTLQPAPPLAERRAPMNFFDIKQYSSNTILTLPFSDLPASIKNSLPVGVQVDSFRVRSNINRLDVVDAWGTIKIPEGQFSVLREKRTEYRQTNFDIKVLFLGWLEVSQVAPGVANLFGVDTLTRFHFFNDREKEEIAIVHFNNELNAVNSVQVKSNAQVSTGVKTSANGGIYIHAFPNPATDWLNFECRKMPSDSYTFKIFSLQGQEIWRGTQAMSGNKSIRVALDGFKNGTYLYRVTNTSGTVLDAKALLVFKP